MKLRTKTVAILVVTTLLLLASLHEVFASELSSSFGQLETGELNQTMGQIHGAFLNDISALNTKVSDWAPWNATYSFITNNDSSYISNNLVPASVASFGVNFMLFINSSGKLVYGLGVNLQNASMIPVPRSLLTLVLSDSRIWDFRDTNSSFAGVASIPEGPLILASQPILTSAATGPIRGAVVFGRYIDKLFVQQLSQTIRLTVALTTYSTWQGSIDSSYVISAPYTYVHPVNSGSIAGYYIVNDINNQPVDVLWTILPRTTYNQGLATLSYIDLSLGLACATFAVIVIALMETTVLSRLHRLVSEVSKVGGDGSTSARVTVSGNDEIGTLASSINGMLEEIDNKSVQLRKSERFSAIGELATMVAHDLRNPLQAISNAAFFLKRSPSAGPKEKEVLARVEDSVRYSDKIVNDLLDYSREVRLEPSETDPHSLVSQSLSMVTVPQNVRIVDETKSSPPVTVDVDKMKRTFVNIISNAIDAMPDGGSLQLRSQRLDHKMDFIFTDTGVGMSMDVIDKAFTPLFTTKARGMGFGLSICKRVVEAHGGVITVTSNPGQGTTFVVSLPLDLKDKEGGEK